MKNLTSLKPQFIFSFMLGFSIFSQAMVAAPNTYRIEIQMSQSERELIKSKKKKEIQRAEMLIYKEGVLKQTLPISLSTRGMTSLSKFSRKNFNIHSLKNEIGESEKIDIGSVEGRKLILSASPEDVLGTKNMLTYKILKNTGVHALSPKYAEVVINRESQGLYFVSRAAQDEILKSKLGEDTQAEIVLRRRYSDKIELKGKKDSLTNLQAQEYIKTLRTIHKTASKLKGEALFAYLEKNLNVEAYMRWIVVNSILKNGDSSDEVFFFGKKLADGSMYFDILPWDEDDTFSKSMHQSSLMISPNYKRAGVAKRTMIFNFESRIDKAVAKDPVMLKKFFAVVSQVISELKTSNAVQTSVDQVIAELTPYLEDADIQAAGLNDSVQKIHNPEEIIAGIRMRQKEINDQIAEMETQLALNENIDINKLILKESFLRSIINRAFLNIMAYFTTDHAGNIKK